MPRENGVEIQHIMASGPDWDRDEVFAVWKNLKRKRPNISMRVLSQYLARTKGWKVATNTLNRWREEDQWDQRYFQVHLEAEQQADEIEVQDLAQELAERRMGERKIVDRAMNGALRLLADAIHDRATMDTGEPASIGEIKQIAETIEKLQRVRDRTVAPLFELPAPDGVEGEGGDGVPALTLQASGVGISSIIEQLNRIAQPKPLSQIIDVTPEPESAE